MGDLLKEYPGAQRALFRAYHIGGCSSCGFSPNETLSGVCVRNENLPIDEVLTTILAGQEADRKMEISPSEIAKRLQRGEQIPLLDVRSREEWDAVHIDGSVFFTQELMQDALAHWSREDLLNRWNPYPLIERGCRKRVPAGHATCVAGTVIEMRCTWSCQRST